MPLGNVQSGFEYLWDYGTELGKLCFPADGAVNDPYPFYDRWGDAFNTQTEVTAADLARSLVTATFLAALTSLKSQPWKFGEAEIVGTPVAANNHSSVAVALKCPALDLSKARIVWEAENQEPQLGTNFTFTATGYGTNWIEAEAQLPDGRRIFAVTNFFVTNDLPIVSVKVNTKQISISKRMPVTFTFMRTGNLDKNLAVNFSLNGTAVKWNDYRTDAGDMPVSVVIPAGQQSQTLTVFGMDNSTGANSETIILALLPGTNYNVGSFNSVTVKINR